MRMRYLYPVSVGVLALMVASCSSKKSGKGSGGSAEEPPNSEIPTSPVDGPSGEDPEDVVAAEDAVVTLASQSLSLASSITILPPKETSMSLVGSGFLGLNLTSESASTHLRVQNDAFEALDQVGSIICFISQTRFWEQANAGVYKAFIDENKCKNGSEGGDSGSGGSSGGSESSSSSKSESLTLAYVEATREEGKPLEAVFRVAPSGGDDNPTWHHGKVVVAAPPSEQNPAGVFSIYYTGYVNDDPAQPRDLGFIRTKASPSGKIILESIGGGGGGDMSVAAELQRVEGSDQFIGRVTSHMSGGEPGRGSMDSRFKVRFDSDKVNVSGTLHMENGDGSYVSDTAPQGCFDRNRFKTSIYRYDLLDAGGEPVKLNSGFPLEIERDGKVYYGNASYWGIWNDPKITLASGDQVFKVDWGNNSKVRTPYTVVKAPGKLVKFSRATLTLGNLKGAELSYWDNTSGGQFIVKWDGTAFVKVASRQCAGQDGCTETPASGTVSMPQWGLNLWADSLSANINIPSNATLSDSYVVKYFAQESVSGTANVPVGNLVCFQDCPVMAPTADAFNRSQTMQWPRVSDLYKKVSVTWWDNSQKETNQRRDIQSALETFTWDASAMAIKSGGVTFALPAGLSSDQSQQQNYDNVWSGPLVPEDAWNAISNKFIDPGMLDSQLEVFYRWQAGPQTWNQYMAVKDGSGTVAIFDKPLEFTYTHSTENDWDGQTGDAVVGKPFRLQYGGPGQLWGIPWKKNTDIGHEMPLFSLKNGVQLGSYTVRALEGEQRMLPADDSSSCSALGLEDMPSFPTSGTQSLRFDVGNDESPLRYISGVLQE